MNVAAATYGPGVDLQIDPVEWELIYPVNPHDPFGWIRRGPDGFHVQLEHEELGVQPTGDRAAEVAWERFLERAQTEHQIASRTHGSYLRHARGT